MKTTFLFILMAGVLSVVSCNKKDDFKGEIEVFDPPLLLDATPVQAKVKQMYTKYNVLFKPTFDLIDYSWNWENKVAQTASNVAGLRYTQADGNYVIPVIDSVEKWVFNVFPDEFSKEYIPLNILLTDTMENKLTSGLTQVHRIYEGYITTNYILLSYVSSRFDAQKNKRFLKESWLSLFVEKMMVRLPVPSQFAPISLVGYGKTTLTNAEDVMVQYAMLKKGRNKQTASTATSAWSRVTMAQDFGDFVAFIVYTPEEEKQLAYAKNANIQTKVTLVKEYFRQNFGFELPYLPTAP